MREEFALPDGAINRHERAELLAGEVLQAAPVQVLVARHPANGTLDADRAPVRPLDDPLENAHVLAEAGPEEIALRVTPEPVHAEDARRIGQMAAKIEPVVEIVRHVIAGE